MTLKFKMDQRANIYLLYKLEKSNEEIYESLKQVYGDQAYSLKTVEYWTKQFKLGRKSINDEPRSGRPADPRIRIQIEAQINEDPYISAHQIARNTGIPYSTVLHILTPEIMEKRVIQAKVILNALQTANRSHFSNIITGDESWFLYVNQPKARWVLDGEFPGDIVERSKYEKKIMVTIFIRKNGTFFVDLLPHGQKFDSNYFVNCIIPQINQLAYPNGWQSGKKKALVHFDNAPSHKSKFTSESLTKFPFKLIPNPIYSPDVAPLDFGVLGTIKERLPYEAIDSDEALKAIIESILGDFGAEFFQKLFRAWEERLIKLIENNGNYI